MRGSGSSLPLRLDLILAGQHGSYGYRELARNWRRSTVAGGSVALEVALVTFQEEREGVKALTVIVVMP